MATRKTARGGKKARRVSRRPSKAGASPPRLKLSLPRPGRSSPRSRLWRYGPVVLWIGIIFFASTGNLSAPNTSRILRPLLLWLFPGVTEATLLQAHFIVRKGAHFTEYAVLALLAARAFLSSSKPSLRRRWWLASLALVASCALLDEYHQSFVATRTGTIYDSLIDIAGGAFAVALVASWRAVRGRRTSFRR